MNGRLLAVLVLVLVLGLAGTAHGVSVSPGPQQFAWDSGGTYPNWTFATFNWWRTVAVQTFTVYDVPAGKRVQQLAFTGANATSVNDNFFWGMNVTGGWTVSGSNNTNVSSSGSAVSMYQTNAANETQAAAAWNNAKIWIKYTDGTFESGTIGVGEPLGDPVVSTVEPGAGQAGDQLIVTGSNWQEAAVGGEGYSVQIFGGDGITQASTAVEDNEFLITDKQPGTFELQIGGAAVKGTYYVQVTRITDSKVSNKKQFAVGDVDTGIISDILDGITSLPDQIAAIFIPQQDWGTELTALLDDLGDRFPFSLAVEFNAMRMQLAANDGTTIPQSQSFVIPWEVPGGPEGTIALESPLNSGTRDLVSMFLTAVLWVCFIIYAVKGFVPRLGA